METRIDADDAGFEPFRRARSELSREAWQSFSEALGCDSGPIAETGVAVFPFDAGLADRLLRAMLASPRASIRRGDFAPGYVSTSRAQCDYLNGCNRYRKLTGASRRLLAEFLSMAGPVIEAQVGHPVRIASTRQFELVPNRPPADRHLDGWPVAIRKLFVLPQGCGRRSSTTWFRRRDGVEFTVESEAPIWMLFENSVVLHAPVSGVALRPTIEFDIVPARRSSFELVDAGLGGWYPLFPSDGALQSATRLALQRYFTEVPEGTPDPTAWDLFRESLRRFKAKRP
ncbi:MAG: hypothetical protein ACOY4R_10605 [Pseudomonadota bacterium]